MDKTTPQQHPELDIIITRELNAPRELVWKVWNDPEHISQWWGPHGFSCPTCEMDLRVGGKFTLQMQGPDGNIYPCKGVYREIVEPERIVYTSEADDIHACGGGLPARSLVTVIFAQLQTKTRITIHTRFTSITGRDAALQMGYQPGWVATLERLEQMFGN